VSPVELPRIRAKVIGDQIEARLRTLSGVKYYRGEVDGDPPLLLVGGQPDPGRRVAPYLIQFTGAGSPYVNGERDLADVHVDATAVHQITCVAGYEADCLQLADRVHDLMHRWSPVVEGLAFGRMRPPSGYDPGFPRVNDQLKGRAPRFSVPLQYRLDATT
jgi:hypothetical protein